MSILFFRVFGRRLAGNQNRYMVLSCKNYFCKTNRENIQNPSLKRRKKQVENIGFIVNFSMLFYLSN